MNQFFGAASVSLMDDGEKVKFELPDGATGVMVMSLYGGMFVKSKVNGEVDDNEDDEKKTGRVVDDGRIA